MEDQRLTVEVGFLVLVMLILPSLHDVCIEMKRNVSVQDMYHMSPLDKWGSVARERGLDAYL